LRTLGLVDRFLSGNERGVDRFFGSRQSRGKSYLLRLVSLPEL
jgi:hypothetical protein